MTPLERAARALHTIYTDEKERSGARDMPSWDELGDDGRFYFTHRVRAVLQAIREPSEAMIEAASDEGGCDGTHISVYRAMIDAALVEQEPAMLQPPKLGDVTD